MGFLGFDSIIVLIRDMEMDKKRSITESVLVWPENRWIISGNMLELVVLVYPYFYTILFWLVSKGLLSGEIAVKIVGA